MSSRALAVSKSQPKEDPDRGNMEGDPPATEKDPKPDPEVIELLSDTDDDEDQLNENKEDKKFTFKLKCCSKDLAPGPSTAEKVSSAPKSVMPSSTRADLGNIRRGSNQSPTARKGLSIPTPVVDGVRIAAQDDAVRQQQHVGMAAAVPRNGTINGGVDANNRHIQQEEMSAMSSRIQALEEQLRTTRGDNEAMRQELEDAKTAFEQRESELEDEQMSTVNYIEGHIIDLEEEMEHIKQREAALAKEVEEARAHNRRLQFQLEAEKASRKEAEAEISVQSAVVKLKTKEKAHVVKKLGNSTKKAEEYQEKWRLAEERVSAKIEALQEKQEANEKLKEVQIQLDTETKLRNESQTRASKADLDTNAAANEAALARMEIIKKDEALRILGEEEDCAAKQAAQNNQALESRLDLELKSAEKAKKKAEVCLLAKDEEIKAIKASTQLVQNRNVYLEKEIIYILRASEQQRKNMIAEMVFKDEKILELVTKLEAADAENKRFRDDKEKAEELKKVRSRAREDDENYRKQENYHHSDERHRKRSRGQ